MKQNDIDTLIKSIDGFEKVVTEFDAKLQKLDLSGSLFPDVVAQGAVRKALGTFARDGLDAELRDLSVGSQEDGGYTVLPTLEAGIRKVAKDTSPIERFASNVTIGTDSYEILLDISDFDSGWVGEGQDRPVTEGPKLKAQSYPVHELFCQPRATSKIIQDSNFDIGAWLESKITEQFSTKRAEAFTTGDGVMKPKGWLSYDIDSKKDFVREWGKWQYVAAGATNPSDEQLADALIKLSMALRVPYRGNARWLMNRETATRIRQLKDSTKSALWFNHLGMTEGTPNTLLGFPVEYDEAMPNIGSGETPVALADWSQAYLIVSRAGTRFVRDETSQKPYVLFYTTQRVGGGAVDFNAAKLLRISSN